MILCDAIICLKQKHTDKVTFLELRSRAQAILFMTLVMSRVAAQLAEGAWVWFDFMSRDMSQAVEDLIAIKATLIAKGEVVIPTGARADPRACCRGRRG